MLPLTELCPRRRLSLLSPLSVVREANRGKGYTGS